MLKDFQNAKVLLTLENKLQVYIIILQNELKNIKKIQ